MAKRPTKKDREKSRLEMALEYVKSIAYGNNAIDGYCRLSNGYVYYNNLVLSAGFPIDLDYSACPDIDKLLKAVAGMPVNTTVTIDRDRILIEYGRKAYTVPCIDPGLVPWAPMTQRVHEADDRLQIALERAAIPTKEGAQRVIEASVLLRPYTAIGCDGRIAVEAYHGIPLLADMRVPTVFVNVLRRLKKEIDAVGYSDVAFTVFFSDGSWLTTQLYVEDAGVDIQQIVALLDPIKAAPVEDDSFFEGIKEAHAYDREAVCRVTADRLTLIRSQAEVFTYRFQKPIQIAEFTTSIENLFRVVELVKNIDVNNSERMLGFTGSNLRGAIARRTD